MTKELFVSSTPHEARVGLVEDDQLAEIYLERENEYTLAGSIYKGRVTRVLPGMQSAFVDIGLERDAFLYVSDFFDEEEEFERIVVDKKKTEGADDESAQRAASERIERQRVERERRVEQAQEEAEPAEAEGAGAAEFQREPEQVGEELPATAAAPAPEVQEAEEAGGRRRRKRLRGEKGAGAVTAAASGGVPPGGSFPGRAESPGFA